jgi:hypothetical protein
MKEEKNIIYTTLLPNGTSAEFEHSWYIGIDPNNLEGVEQLDEGFYQKKR